MFSPIQHRCVLASLAGVCLVLEWGCAVPALPAAGTDTADEGVPAEVRVIENADGSRALWLIHPDSGEPAQLLVGDESLELVPHFSPDFQWLVVEDRRLDHFQTVRLFHRGADGGFRQIASEQITGPLWEEFHRDHALGPEDVASAFVRIVGWSEDSRTVTLGLAVDRLDGSRLEELYVLDFAGYLSAEEGSEEMEGDAPDREPELPPSDPLPKGPVADPLMERLMRH